MEKMVVSSMVVVVWWWWWWWWCGGRYRLVGEAHLAGLAGLDAFQRLRIHRRVSETVRVNPVEHSLAY